MTTSEGQLTFPCELCGDSHTGHRLDTYTCKGCGLEQHHGVQVELPSMLKYLSDRIREIESKLGLVKCEE